MQSTSQLRRLVLVPAPPTPSRGDELIRRYRLARVRLAERTAEAAARTLPEPRSG